MEYRIIEHTNITQFEMLVDSWLAAGWILQGGVSSGIRGFAQAMISQKQ